MIAAMDYYYFVNPIGQTKLVAVTGNGLHFDYADIGIDQNQLEESS